MYIYDLPLIATDTTFSVVKIGNIFRTFFLFVFLFYKAIGERKHLPIKKIRHFYSGMIFGTSWKCLR
jgi:hypothetical protein